MGLKFYINCPDCKGAKYVIIKGKKVRCSFCRGKGTVQA